MSIRRALLVFVLGLFALLAQTLLFRDFLAAFEGSELGIGCFFGTWLLWVALGAILGRYCAAYGRRLPALVLLYIPAFVIEHYLIRSARDLAGITSYDLFPYRSMITLALLTNAPVSAVTGLLFTLACPWLAENKPARPSHTEGHLPVAWAYILETLGAAAGGIGVTFALTLRLPPQTVFLAGALVLSAAVAAVWRARLLRFLPPVTLAAILLLNGGGWWAERDARASWSRLLPQKFYQGRFATAQAEYLYGEREGQFIVLCEGATCETLPNRERGGEVTAITLSQCPVAERVLVLGPMSLAICRQFAALPQIKDVVWLHPDPEYPQRLAAALSEPFLSALDDVTIPQVDGRTYLESTEDRFDLIILNLPDATTLVLNRCFTREFLSLVKNRLNKRGVAALRLTGASNFLGGELANLGASAMAIFEDLFKTIALKPGDESWLMGSQDVSLTESPEILRDRFAAIHGAATVYPAENLISLYPPDRIAFQQSRYRETLEQTGKDLLINTDQHPKALLFTLLLALRQAGVRGLAAHLPVFLSTFLGAVLAAVLSYAPLRCVYLLRSRASGSRNAELPQDHQSEWTSSVFDGAFLVSVMGLAGMSISIVLMFAYQARFGSLFLHIGFISALFMAGSFLGGGFSARILAPRTEEPRALLPVCLIAHLALAGLIALAGMNASRTQYNILFSLAGLFTGIYFPIAAHRLRSAHHAVISSGAALETLDHLGAAIGAVVTGLFLLPLFGARATLGLLALLIAANIPVHFLRKQRCGAADQPSRIIRPLAYTLFGAAVVCLIASHAAERTAYAGKVQLAIQAMIPPGGEVPLEKHEMTLEDGRAITYFSATGADLATTYYFSSEPFASDIFGFAGPVDLAIVVKQDGTLKNVRITASWETPTYLELVEPWLTTLAGRNLFAPEPFQGVDTVSGATLTSSAVLRGLEASGRAFAAHVLKQAPETAPQSSTPPIDTRTWWMAAFLAGAVLMRFRPGKWRRRAFLAATAIVLGYYYNLQYSTQQAFSLLAGNIATYGWTATFLLTIIVPVLTLLVGNVYCGYICPFGALQELLGDLRPRWLNTDPDKDSWRYARWIKYALLFLLVLIFAATRDYNVLSADPLVTVFGALREQNILILGLILLALSIPFRRFWCRNLCPAGAFLALLNHVRLLRKLSPPTLPRRCDLGVRNREELDCLRCDRCVYRKETPPPPEKSSPHAAHILLPAVIAIAAIITISSFHHAGHTIEAWTAITPAPAGFAGKPREVDLPRIQRLIEKRDLSDREADFYRPFDNPPQ